MPSAAARWTFGPFTLDLANVCLWRGAEAVGLPPKAFDVLHYLGGAELTYGSDLDIIFVADPKAKNLPLLQRLAAEIMDLLSSPTELGVAFVTDARLRPDGEKGLLVNTLDAYEDYYRRRAMLWEIQCLTRARPVAGDMKVGRQFQRLAATLANFTPENVAAAFGLRAGPAERPTPPAPPDLKVAAGGLAAYRPDWKMEISRMRARTGSSVSAGNTGKSKALRSRHRR